MSETIGEGTVALAKEPDRLLETLKRVYWGGSQPPTYVLTRWLFLRLLGFIYLFAFASLWSQITGLVGSHGILPVANFFESIQRIYGPQSYQLVPSLVWLNTGDDFLRFLCGAGTALSVLLILDIAPAICLALLWVFYISLTYAGQDFLLFQWDILLLEAGFLAILFSPWHIVPGRPRQSAPPVTVLWLLRLLLFRLMFDSGLVKLLSRDPTWRDLTATTYHYQTQPLPTPLAWYMHQLPLEFHKAEVLITFLVELIVPFLIFAPRRLRIAGAILIAGQQLMIFLTGNYTFFNLLTLTLCVSLLDDKFLQQFLPARIRAKAQAMIVGVKPAIAMYRRVIVGVIAAVIIVLGISQVIGLLWPQNVPSIVTQLSNQLEPYRIVNGYGLFAVMTTTRPEIIIEGSNDGQQWIPYAFKYKPGDLARSPVWVAPHQPRLDWQMWFEALGGTPDQWFFGFVKRLLEGSPDVLALMDTNPFPNAPPRYIRAMLYNYSFTDEDTRARTGNWWQRKELGTFLQPISLKELQGKSVRPVYGPADQLLQLEPADH